VRVSEWWVLAWEGAVALGFEGSSRLNAPLEGEFLGMELGTSDPALALLYGFPASPEAWRGSWEQSRRANAELIKRALRGGCDWVGMARRAWGLATGGTGGPCGAL